jgi:heterokaryon incompatibility protein (HET)
MVSPASHSSLLEYEYSPIQEGQIRLLRVTTNEDGSPSGTLKIVRLGHHDCPSYKTLSYVWGDPGRRWPIQVDGRYLQVLESLKPFMYLLQNRLSRNTWWWIDSICIDPQNLNERSYQIQLMGQIYRQSKETVVWLGPKSPDSDEAIDFLRYLSKKRFQYSRVVKKDEKAQAKMMADACVREDKEPHWDAVQELFARPWWTRVWTLQEFILSKEVVFYCGDKHLSRKLLDSSLFAIWLCSYATKLPVNKGSWSAAWSRRRLLQWYRHKDGRKLQDSGPMQLVSMLAYFSDHDSTIDHDRIYSLLGLAADSRKLVPSTSYECSVEEVYTQFVTNFIQAYNNLDIICFTQIFKDKTATPGLPSWVPDWRVKMLPPVTPLMVSQSSGEHIGNFRPLHALQYSVNYCASGNLLPQVKFENGVKLQCSGIKLDIVDGLSACFSNERTEGQLAPMVQSISEKNISVNTFGDFCRSRNDSYGLLHHICRTLVLDRRDRYLSHPAPIPDLASQFVSFCSTTLSDPSAVSWRFSQWFEENKKFKMQGLSLENLATETSMNITPSPVDLFDTSNWESFLARFSDTTMKMTRRLMTTNTGLIGMAPLQAEQGDAVCVLFGCSVPVLLRKANLSREYKLVGECYVDGYMAGEACDDYDKTSTSAEAFIIS